MHASMQAYIRTYVHACVHTWRYTYNSMYTRADIHTYSRTYILAYGQHGTHIHRDIRVPVFIYIYIYIYIHIYMHPPTHPPTHASIRMCACVCVCGSKVCFLHSLSDSCFATVFHCMSFETALAFLEYPSTAAHRAVQVSPPVLQREETGCGRRLLTSPRTGLKKVHPSYHRPKM